MIELIKDAYSPSSEMELIKNNYDIGLVHGIVSADIMLKDNLYPKNEKEKIGSIVLSYGSPMITDKVIENDRIKVEGMLKVSALYRTTDENMQINMCDGEIPFSTIVDLKGTKPHMNAIIQVHLESLDSTVEANTIAVRATLSLSAKISYKVNREWIVDVVQVRDEPKDKAASVTIYFVNKGDTLWSLAKKYGTTMDVLIKINELDDPDTLNVGQKLIIPGRAIL
jgi:LysM repeat protein